MISDKDGFRGLIDRSAAIRAWAAATRQESKRLRAESASARLGRCVVTGCICRDKTAQDIQLVEAIDALLTAKS